jgi:outer membrane receptor protein involved in Fe transport
MENLIQLNEHLILNLGGRLDYFDLNRQLTWSPRINLSYQLDETTLLRCAWGYYYQFPNYRQIAYAFSSDTNTQAQLAIHYVLGADYLATIGPGSKSYVKLKAEIYFKDYKQLMNATLTSDGYIYYSRKNDAVGSSYGVDLYAMYSSPGFDGWISYGYLVASQNLLTDNTGEFPRYTDQRHTLALVGTWELGSGWSMNMRYVYGSGYPFTPLYPEYDQVNIQWNWISDKPNSHRLPSYARVDARVTKDFELFELPASVFIDISNLTNATNIQAYRYTFDSHGQPVTKDVALWPIIPTIGLSVRF